MAKSDYLEKAMPQPLSAHISDHATVGNKLERFDTASHARASAKSILTRLLRGKTFKLMHYQAVKYVAFW